MSDWDKIHIKQLDDKADYGLWEIRVEATCSAKGVHDALNVPVGIPIKDSHKTIESGIIVSALSDSTLRVVRSVICDPAEIMKKSDGRFESRSTASNISKLTEFVSARFVNIKSDITKHIDRMAYILEQLKAMDVQIDNSMQVCVLLASVYVLELGPVTAVIKTLA